MEFQRPTNIIPTPWADQGTYETIPATQVSSGRASWDAGFPLENTIPVSSGGIPANYNDFQGVLHDLSEHTCYQQTGGLYAWTSSIDYPVGAIVQGGDAKTYQAVAKNGPNTSVVNPTTDSSGSYWNTFIMSGGTATYAADASSLGGVAASGYVTISGAQTISGTKTFQQYIQGDLQDFRIINVNDNSTHDTKMTIIGGNNKDYGACLQLLGTGASSDAGYFELGARGSSTKWLVGQPNGNLTWDGKDIITDGGNQNISGVKTFQNSFVIANDGYSISRPDNTKYIQILAGASLSNVQGATLTLYGGVYSGASGIFSLRAATSGTQKLLDGKPDGTLIWAGQPVQTSSDERVKTAISSIPDDVLDAWGGISWEQFKYKEDAERKGIDNCRFHPGMIAQHVMAVFDKHGKDACEYGILCHDEWQDEYAEKEDGTRELIREAGDLWTVRYTEALCIEAAYQRRRADRAEARITALEQRLNEMEAVLASLISPVQSDEPVVEQEPVVEEPTTVEESTDTEQEPVVQEEGAE